MSDDALLTKIALSMENGVACGGAPSARAFEEARRELEFTARHGIRILCEGDPEYPYRLAQISGTPPLLYVLGQCDLNSLHPVSIVGTRKMTPYGADITSKLTRELAEYFPDLLVVSGLAYGVDSVAHSAALQAGVRTVGVMAHGLHMIYPAQHRDLASRIISAGGAIISQYPSGTSPFRNNFLERNRIVAGMSDVTVVIESEVKGGAMSTARHAFEADREVFAIPGRVSDEISAGCNHLISCQRARIYTTVANMIENVGWELPATSSRPIQRSLFPELDGDGLKVYEYLRHCPDPQSPDIISQLAGVPISRLIGLMSELEFEGVVIRHPGNRYSATI
ncbi:MAG: DNA-processing protein DprA [Muribaculaceae bacterium]|nr:DNA-processing protein DprA [Muribaculaceae bacterium]